MNRKEIVQQAQPYIEIAQKMLNACNDPHTKIMSSSGLSNVLRTSHEIPEELKKLIETHFRKVFKDNSVNIGNRRIDKYSYSGCSQKDSLEIINEDTNFEDYEFDDYLLNVELGHIDLENPNNKKISRIIVGDSKRSRRVKGIQEIKLNEDGSIDEIHYNNIFLNRIGEKVDRHETIKFGNMLSQLKRLGDNLAKRYYPKRQR